MLGKRKNAIDKGKYLETLLTDLSKALDCFFQEMLVAKLHAYGFDLLALKSIQSYISSRKQMTKISLTYITHGQKFCLEYQKDLFLVLCYVIFFCVICLG